MKLIRSFVVFLLFVVLNAFSYQPAGAQTRLGLHVTQEELNIWRQRAQSGPYRTAGDVSANSPGDWTRIVQRANSWASGSPTAERWLGNNSGQPFYQNGKHASCSYGTPCVPGNLQGRMILNAAFAWLVDPTTHNHVAGIRTALLDQISIPGADFTNSTLWPDHHLTDGWVMAITNYLTRLIFAYSYVRHSNVFSAQERFNIDRWFSNAAYYWAKQTDTLIRNAFFPNRNTEFDTSVAIGDIYPTSNAGNHAGTVQSHLIYFNCTANAPGPRGTIFHEVWSNRSASLIRFAAAGSLINGTLANDPQTQRWVKMWIKEHITYGTFSNNMSHEYRWGPAVSNIPTLGWSYSSLALGSIVSAADMLARKGDTSLYTWSTSAGITFSQTPESNTTGGPKSILGMVQRHSGFIHQRTTQNPNWYAAPNNSRCGDLNYLIQPNDFVNGEFRVMEHNYVPANLFYRDAAYKAAYTRAMTGAPAYPSHPTNYLDPWTGEWNVYPAPLFMFGQMEGKLWPYPTGGSGSSAPVSPSSLGVTITQQ